MASHINQTDWLIQFIRIFNWKWIRNVQNRNRWSWMNSKWSKNLENRLESISSDGPNDLNCLLFRRYQRIPQESLKNPPRIPKAAEASSRKPKPSTNLRPERIFSRNSKHGEGMSRKSPINRENRENSPSNPSKLKRNESSRSFQNDLQEKWN